MIIEELKIALKCYFATFTISFLIGVLNIYLKITSFKYNFFIFTLCLICIVTSLKLIYNKYEFQYAIRASILGFIFSVGVYTKLVTPDNIQAFGGYMCVIVFFHFSEFVTITFIKPELVKTSSFMINHSPEYIIAAVSSWVEFFVETYFFPGMKELNWLSNIGLVICICGEVLRKVSMLTAGSNFHHCVQCEKSKDHELVTHGVYSIFRHPSYVGWFYWSIGTQIILLNPICLPAYTIVGWMFFNSRIHIEEIALLNFFGENYCNYQKEVGTGIPFIKGYIIK